MCSGVEIKKKSALVARFIVSSLRVTNRAEEGAGSLFCGLWRKLIFQLFSLLLAFLFQKTLLPFLKTLRLRVLLAVAGRNHHAPILYGIGFHCFPFRSRAGFLRRSPLSGAARPRFFLGKLPSSKTGVMDENALLRAMYMADIMVIMLLSHTRGINILETLMDCSLW